MPLLEVTDLRVDFPNGANVFSAVRGVSFSLEARECLGVVGESGSGKSLTALAIADLLPRGAVRRAAQLRFAGRDLLDLDEAALAQEIRGRRIGFVFQEPMTSLNPVIQIGAQMSEAMTIHGLADHRTARRRAIELMERVGVTDAERRLLHYPHQLSGGQRQRVMIAMALMNKPDLLIADEPTTALDVSVQAQIIALLDELRREMNLAVILITHNLALVSHVADATMVMYAGEVVEAGPTRAVIRDPRHPYTAGLLASTPECGGRDATGRLGAIPGAAPSGHTPPGCGFAPRCDRAQAACSRPVPIGADGGRTLRCLFPIEPPRSTPRAITRTPRRGAEARATALEVEDLSKIYRLRRGLWGGEHVHRAVNGVSFTLEAGETLGIVGESGSGKSTLAKLLTGLEAPSAGAVRFAGAPLHGRLDRARRIQLVFQDPFSSLNPSCCIHDIVRRPLDIHRRGGPEERDTAAAAMLDRVGLARRLHAARPSELSGGQRQRVGLARALILEPEILVCDEPTSALDVSVQAQILNLLFDLQAQFGLTMVLISHDLAVVRHVADRIAVMRHGEVVESGDAAAVFEAPQHAYTRELLAASLRIDEELSGARARPGALHWPKRS
jgi:peptide/nickel transport system ATP-binding protein